MAGTRTRVSKLMKRINEERADARLMAYRSLQREVSVMDAERTTPEEKWREIKSMLATRIALVEEQLS